MHAKGWAVASRRFDAQTVLSQSREYQETGRVSSGNADGGFFPACCDTQTSCDCLSRFADGCLAPVHVLDGLPENLVLEWDPWLG